jgi:diguanylate cyclase (GGDEF)-like protein
MMLQIVISVGFYLSFILYLLLGLYSITLNKKEALNRVFLCLCLCFSIWAYTFAIGNSARTYEDALIWYRISSLGWGVTYSVIVHFTLVLTEANRLLKARLVYVILYLPAAINVFFFGIYSKVANAQYNLVHTQAGWANISLYNLGDLFFYSYYLVFSLLTFILLFRWRAKTKDSVNKKYAVYLLMSFGGSLLLGILIDILANQVLSFKIPSLSPIMILIPVITIHYIIRKYGLMQPKEKKISPEEGIILSDDNRASLYKYISIILFGGSFLNIMFCLMYSVDLVSGVFVSTILALIGSIIYIVPYTITSIKYQENILTTLMAIVMLMAMFFPYNLSVSNIVWPVPMFIIIATIIFNNKKMFWIIAVESVLAGMWSWAREPKSLVEIGNLEYISRIVFYIIGIGLIGYINKIYISRLRENDKQVEFQKIISSISTSLVTITSSNFDDKITELLEKSGCYILADRSYLGLLSEDQQMINYTHKWIGEGITPLLEHSEENQFVPLNWSNSKLSANKIVFIPDVDELPPEAIMEKKIMLSQGIKSLISIPISSKDKVIGVLRFDQIKTQKRWRIEDRDLLKVLTNMLAEAITKVKVEKEISYLAYYDALTGLPNRTLINNRLEQAIPLARRNEKMIGVIFIDLDGFKSVNDTMGHNWGDNLLKQVADRLSQCITKYGTVARFGGDEFLIMIPQIFHVKDVEETAKKVMKTFNRHIIVNKQEFFLTASAGIAIFPQDGEEANILIKNADIAMYSAKNNGKGQYIFCTSEMKDDTLNKMMLTNSLYRALDRNELVLNYQPQVSIDTKEIIGMEALIRWDHPDLGRIPPNIFIPIAEQTGLINAIGEWVLNTACRQNKTWQDLGFKPIQMAVNVSVEQFRSGKLKQIVEDCLEKTGLDPRYLELEITEGIAMKETDYILKALHGLKMLGISISIDDFGTEFSSLSRLKDLPVDRLKIDMQFVRGIAVNSKDEAIIKVIINLARSLGLKVIAEGVETEVQLKFLTDEACEEIQGYYYYKPMSKEELEACVFVMKN